MVMAETHRGDLAHIDKLMNSSNRENVEQEDRQALNASLRLLSLTGRALTNGWDREGSALRLRTSVRWLPV